jgi:hypothetical protein
MGKGSDNQTVCTQWGQPELCGGLRLPPMGTTGKRVFAATYEEASARIQGLKRGGSRFSKLGGLENHGNSTGPRNVLAAGLSGGGPFGSPLGRAAPGPSGLPPGNGGVQEFDLRRVEVAAAAFVPLRMDPDPEGMFTLGVAVLMTGPIVAFLAVGRELGQAVVPAGFVLGFPAVVQPPWHPGETGAVGRVEGAVGGFAPAPGQPPSHRPFAPVAGTAVREPGFGRDPGDDLFHAGQFCGGGERAGCCTGGGLVFGLEARILAAKTAERRRGPGQGRRRGSGRLNQIQP